MRSILKQTSLDSITPSITFDNYCDERIRIMKNSADEYTKFLTQLDELIARIDLTMETTRLPFKRKIVRFAEHNEIFLIPPRETPPILTIPNFDVFYFTKRCLLLETLVLTKPLSLPTFYSETLPSPLTFDMSTYYSLVEETSETIMQPSSSFAK